jgi:hypothetical protein
MLVDKDFLYQFAMALNNAKRETSNGYRVITVTDELARIAAKRMISISERIKK